MRKPIITNKSKKVTLDFIIFSIAFLSLFTETLSYHTKTLQGFVIFGFSAFIIILAKKQKLGLDNSHMKVYKILLVTLLIYLLSLLIQSYFFGNGFSDWRFFSTPIIIAFSIYFSNKYLENSHNYNRFFNLIILVFGLQSFINFIVLKSSPGLARSEEIILYNLFVIGGPNSFATKAMIIPFLIWFTFARTYFLRRLINITMITFIILSVIVSSYATSILFLVLGIFMFIFYIIIVPFNYKKSIANYFLGGMLILLLVLSYRFTYDNPIFEGFYYRYENLVDDPTSGGYSGIDRKESRWDKSLVSINSFLNNPIFGNNSGLVRVNKEVGGHSSLFDSLAAYGLLGGGLAFVYLIFILYKLSLFNYIRQRNYLKLTILISTSLFVIGGIVNPFWEGYQPAIIILIMLPQLNSSLEK
jgi:hypothetical protein